METNELRAGMKGIFKDMSDEQINLAIAEACGWKIVGYQIGWGIDPSGEKAGEIPNYCNDLNAMHEAEKVFDSMDYQFKNTYAGTLENILKIEVKKSDPDCYPDVYGFEWIHATARQRAEAFLKTIGKWTTPKPTNGK